MIHNIDLSTITAEQVTAVKPEGGFQVILADPPWKFSSNSAKNPGRNAMRHYPCMKTDDICDMPIRDMSAKDSMLLLWATSPMLQHAERVMDAWGFKYKSNLVWVKSKVGMGMVVRNQHEHVLIGRRGRFNYHSPALFPTSIIYGETREHSRKPNEWLEPVNIRYPDAPKVELFARAPREGWTVMGNQVEKFMEVENG